MSQNLVTLLPSFELHLRAEAKSPKTVRTYRAAVLQFVGWLQKAHPGVMDWDAVTRDQLREWSVSTILRTSAGNASVHWRGLQQFLKWAELEDEIRANPMRNLSGPQPTPPVVPVIEIEQLSRLLAVVAGSSFIERRDNAILRLLIDTGIRRGELVGLQLDDVKLFEREATVTGKGSRTRTVRFGARTAKAIDRYLARPRRRRGRPDGAGRLDLAADADPVRRLGAVGAGQALLRPDRTRRQALSCRLLWLARRGAALPAD